ncbi:MAG: N-acetylmuramoyl-L-alanine amidase [Synergistaceae bacterium]|jgi:N-acetylmuramoyl-L-alanine amidase|nr:N-acetylmuramoyl-L-alanine amidase [Synergistaceae bacterium]
MSPLPAAARARRFLTRVILACVILSLAAGESGALEMLLMQGDIRKGRVSFIERDGMEYAALDEMLASLGFAPSPADGGFIVTFSGKKVEFWSGSAVARLSGTVYSMPSTVFFQDGHWWGEANSSLAVISQFLSSAGRPSDIRWSPAGGGGTALPVLAPAAPQIKTPRADAAPGGTLPAGAAAINGVRWGEQLDAYRAVVDISKQVDASMKEYPDRVEVTFRGTASPQIAGNSPWPPLQAASSQSGGDTVIVFRHGGGRVRGFWVEDPPRYVVDFYFGGGGGSSAVTAPDAPPGIIRTQPGTGSPPPPSGAKKFLVVVDAGHGGHDPGAIGNAMREKDINLKASVELAESLRAIGLDVKLTRADDRYLKLAERTAFANENNADIFISLHCNALPKGKHASGTELYLMAATTDRDALNLAIIENRELSGDAQNAAEINAAADRRTQLLLKILGDMQQNDKISQSTTLAEFMYERMRADGFSIRKVLQAPFFVLRGAGMPALLVEMGYITESSDAKNLGSQAYRKKMMNSLARGISNYLKAGYGEGGG